MGLDNGIIVKSRNAKNFQMKFPSFIKTMSWLDLTNATVEVAYWRKTWGIRDKILDILGGENDSGEYEITQSQLFKIIKMLKKFLHEDYWIKNAHSIWEYDDMIENQVQILVNLYWLSDYMKKEGKNIKVIFYDSY